MDQFPPPEPPDLTLQLPRDLYYQSIHELCAGLPPPVTASPEDRARRHKAAIAVVASLLPANGEEVTLAAQSLPPGLTRWCRRRQRPGDGVPAAGPQIPGGMGKCTAQSASMMRQARAARSLLLRVQAERRKREADGVALGKAAWIEHCAIGLMALGAGRAPPEPMAEPDQ